MTDSPAYGIYEELLHHRLQDLLRRHPELRSVFGKLDPEEQPARYATFVMRVVEQALREVRDENKRLDICNRIIGLVAHVPGLDHLSGNNLIGS